MNLIPAPKKIGRSKIRAIKEAGFYGVAAACKQCMEPTPELKKLADEYGLAIVGYQATAKAKEFYGLLKSNADNGAHYINVQLADEDTLTPQIKEWLPFAEALFRVWRQGKQEGREHFVIPEMGPIPGGYNLSLLPKSWVEDIVLKGLTEKAWKASALPPKK